MNDSPAGRATSGSEGTSSSLKRVVVVGASLAGLRAAETLRSADADGNVFDGEVVVLGAEPHRPYDRPPLSKKLLSGEWEPDRIQLRQPDSFDDLDVEWRFGVAASGIDIAGRRIQLSDGSSLDFDGCVIATGAFCRRLPDQGRFDHVHEVRTLDDSMRLRAELLAGDRRVVVVGAGFIGLEVAATARRLGNDVTVLEGASAPLIRGLGAEMGAAIGALHEAEGVTLRCDVRISRLDAQGVVLDDGSDGGELVEADVVVVGIGVSPATSWLDGSGLDVRDGVVCDETLRARGADGGLVDGVYAAGDVLRWPNPLFAEEMRVEHWTNAAEQGAIAVKNMLAVARGNEPEPYAPVPFFWSDQYDHRIQFLGRVSPDDEVCVAVGSVDDGKFLTLYGKGGTLHGALGVNAPRWIMPMRKLFLAGASWDDALEHAATLAT